MLVTNGSLQADAFLFDHLVQPGDAVVVERPTYDRTLLNLRNMGGRGARRSPPRPDGIDIDELRKLLESGVRPKLAHIIPNYQNPAGVTLSLEKRRALLDLAARVRVHDLRGRPVRRHPVPRRAAAVDALAGRRTASWCTPSSFTKTVCPGVRVGYLVGPAPLIAEIAKTATNLYISPGMVSQAIVHQFCVSGDIDRSIATVCAALGERARVLAGVAARAHPGRPVHRAGRRLLPLGRAARGRRRRQARCRPPPSAGVAVVKGSDFLLEGGRHALRLAYSAVTVDQIDEGVRRLAAAVEAVRDAELLSDTRQTDALPEVPVRG